MEYTLDKYKNLVQYLLSLQFTDYSGIKDGDGWFVQWAISAW